MAADPDMSYLEIEYADKMAILADPMKLQAHEYNLSDDYDNLYDTIAGLLHAGFFRLGIRLYRNDDILFTMMAVDSYLMCKPKASVRELEVWEVFVLTLILPSRERPMYLIVFLGNADSWAETQGQFSVHLRDSWVGVQYDNACRCDVQLHELD